MPYKDPLKRLAAQARWKQRYRDDPVFRAQKLAWNKAYNRRNPEIARAATRRWQAKNREKNLANIRAYHLRRDYGLTAAEYDALLAAQGGVCAICGGLQRLRKNYRMAVDHDHATGAVRGLLCNRCNVGLANFGEDRDRLAAAIAYLG